MRKLLSLALAVLFTGMLGACEEQPTTPEATSEATPSGADVANPNVGLADAGMIASKMADAGMVGARTNSSSDAGVVKEEATLLIVDTPEGVPAKPVGTVTLRRKPANNTLNWTLKAEGLGNDGHAWTIWWGNPPFTTSGGWGGGGVISNGSVTASNNHCTWSLETFWDGGFRPGKEPTCDRVDASEMIIVNLLIHDEWEPGDMMERWDPDGDPVTRDDPNPGNKPGPADQCFEGENADDECDSFKEPNRTLIAVFPALED